MPATEDLDTADLDAAARAVVDALTEWVAAVAAVRAEVRADAVAAGGDPDGPWTTARVRAAVADARAALPAQDLAAYDALMARTGPAGGGRQAVDSGP